MSKISDLHDAVKRGDLAEIKALLEAGHSLANARSRMRNHHERLLTFAAAAWGIITALAT